MAKKYSGVITLKAFMKIVQKEIDTGFSVLDAASILRNENIVKNLEEYVNADDDNKVVAASVVKDLSDEIDALVGSALTNDNVLSSWEGYSEADAAKLVTAALIRAVKDSVDTLTSELAEVKETANTAKSTAEEAKETAEGADGKADEAKSTADQAKEAAEGAVSDASEAKSTAEGAESTANTAKSTADAAKESAESATQTANEANSTATDAKETAESAKSQVNAINEAKGKVNGIATLDDTGKVPSSQLPSYVDDVIEGFIEKTGGTDDAPIYTFYEPDDEGSQKTDKVIQGEKGKIYVDLKSNRSYRWSGSTYIVIESTDMIEITDDEVEQIWNEVLESMN